MRCDETKPECNICVRRGTKCPGYRPTQSFILHRFDQQTDKPELIKEDESRYKYANKSPTTTITTSPRSSQSISRRSSAEEKPVDTTLPKRVSSIAADRIQHVGTFISLYLPSADGPALPPPSALMLALPTLPANSEVLLAAVDAVSAAQLAVNNRNYPLINRSRSLYGTALSQMLKAIQDPVTAVKDETLLSTYLLTLYEVFVGITQGHGFFYHVQGLLHLLKQRGPSSFQSRMSLQIYHAIRYNSVSSSISVPRTMLNSPS